MSSERGAILIHVAVASLVLIAFTMFVVDYGIMWVSRNQAQNSADAGALAGAVALAYDDSIDRSETGPAKLSAHTAALLNDVFGADPDVDIIEDIIFYPDDPSKFPAECADDTCIRVDVYRNQDRNNPLPMWFGQLVGLNEQGVRATAIAQAGAGNAAECVKPWVVADRWDEDPTTPGIQWTQSDPFNVEGDSDPDSDGQWDSYVSPAADPVNYTGFGRADDAGNPLDYGYQFILRISNPGGGSELDIRSPGWVFTVELPNAAAGGGQNQVTANISGCTDALVTVAAADNPCTEESTDDDLTTPNVLEISCLGVQPGNAWNPQEGALEDWISENGTNDDLNDRWLTGEDAAGCADPTVGCPSSSSSRRIIPLALFDPAHYAASDATGETGIVKIVSILGFFVEGTCDGNGAVDPPGAGFFHETYLSCTESGPANELVGRLVTIPGAMAQGGGNNGAASFTQVVRLIR